MTANNTGPGHYKDKPMQPWDFIVSNNLGYLEGNVIKYISRWKEKGGVEDLRKAKHYIEKLIEVAMNPDATASQQAHDSLIRAQRATWDARTKDTK